VDDAGEQHARSRGGSRRPRVDAETPAPDSERCDEQGGDETPEPQNNEVAAKTSSGQVPTGVTERGK